jgi:hypothetical protein
VERTDIRSRIRAQFREEAVRKGEEKLQEYQKEFKGRRKKDIDSTMNAFHHDFATSIAEDPEERGKFIAVSQAREGEASYMNIINTNTGEIRGLYNDKCSTEDWHFSEVVFNQFQLAMHAAKKDIASFDLKNWRGERLTNEQTKRTVALFLPNKTNKCTFEKDSQGFIALAGTETAQSKFYLVAQHQKAFGEKEVTSITVERQSNGDIHINYSYT